MRSAPRRSGRLAWASIPALVASLALVAGLGGAGLGCGGLGVERYREAAPRASFEARLVHEGERADAERLPRLAATDPPSDDGVRVEPGVILRASHVRHVQLVESAEGRLILVLELSDEGRARLLEAHREGRSLALVADGRVIATLVMRGALAEGEIVLGVAQPEAAFEALTAPAAP